MNQGIGLDVTGVHLIDCDVIPLIPKGWDVRIAEHRKGGQLEWNLTNVAYYLSKSQENGNSIIGHELFKELLAMPVWNANVLDYFLANPNIIPDERRGKYLVFWGTIYRDSSGRLFVRYLYWRGKDWRWDSRCLDREFFSNSLALVPSSNQNIDFIF